MRIAQLTQDWSVDGGLARYVRDLTAALRGAGHEVLVVRARDDATGTEPGCHTVPEFGALAEDHVARQRGAAVLDILDQFRPDVVHLQSNNNFALEAAIRQRYPSLKTLHVYDFCPSGNKYHHASGRACSHPSGPLCVPRMVYKRCLLDKRPAVIWRAYRRAMAANRSNASSPALVVASEYVRRAAVATGYPASQVRTLPLFTIPPPAPSPPSHGDTVFFSGRIVREKGLHVLLAALARVARPWRLLVAGDGMDRARAERLARRLGVADRVTFLGWLDRAGIARCLTQATVVAIPSLWPEPFGLVGLEAMAYARAVVAFSVGAIPEWLADGETGLLAPPADVGALAERLALLLGDRALATSLGACGRARVEREFSPTVHVERLLAIYAEVIVADRRPTSHPRGGPS